LKIQSISTTKLFLAEIFAGAYNSNRWTSKPAEIYSVNIKTNLQATGTTHNNKKCNGTGLVLKICETKNNVWKIYII